MSNAVDHIGVMVGDLDAAVAHYQDLFHVPDREVFFERGYRTGPQELDVAFVKTASIYFEFFQAVSDGPIRDLHDRRGDGVHHVAMRCDDVRAEWHRHAKRTDHFGLIGTAPTVDANGCSFWLLHPKRNFGVLVEPQAAWARTSVANFTQLEATPDWASELGATAAAGAPR